MNLNLLKLKAKAKGLVSNGIAYNPLIENGDSSPYFGTYEGQKYGLYDTSSCWDFSGCEIAETRLELLMKKGLIPKETIDWLIKNRYIDEQGDFYLSRRWVAILSGVRDQGNYEGNFWELASVAGLIPNWMLPYSAEDAFDEKDQSDFNNEYFDISVITKEMEEMGLEFLKRFSINFEAIEGGFLNDISAKLQTYLKEGSLQIGISTPLDGSWNHNLIKWDGRMTANHSVELYKFDQITDYPYFIYDTYKPNLKQLSNDYYIPIITRISISPIQTPVFIDSTWSMFWQNVFAWLKGLKLPYKDVKLG